MKVRILLLICFSAFSSLSIHAQYYLKENSKWAFGNKAGIDFSTGIPVPITTGIINADEGSATISDANGALLFYTEGSKIWDRNHNLMPNGTNLTNGIFTQSSTQASVIVPMLNNAGKYYVFSLTQISGGGRPPVIYGQCKLFYSIADINLNNGLGDVVTGQKAVLLDTNLTERMIAVQGNDCNIWLLVQDKSQLFRAYSITDTGINLTPVVSPRVGNMPPVNNSISSYPTAAGVMKSSPDRSKLAVSYYLAPYMNGNPKYSSVELYDFNPATGIVNNAIVVDSSSVTYGLCFSPDGKKLYVTGYLESGFKRKNFVDQFDLSTGIAAGIQSSRYTVDSVDADYVDLQLGPDEKMYTYHFAATKLHVINVPNAQGAACNFQRDAIHLEAGTNGGWGLPSTVVKLLPDTTIAISDTEVCVRELPLHVPPGYTSYIWDDGSTDTTRSIAQRGTYWLTSTDRCHIRIDSFKITGTPIPVASITVNGFVLGTTNSYATYQWYLDGNVIPGATDATYTVSENGTYSVKVSDGNGCTDSTSYQVINVSVSSTQLLGQRIIVSPNPASHVIHITAPVPVSVHILCMDGKVALQENGVKNVDISLLAQGMYLLHIRDEQGVLLKTDQLIKLK